MAKDHFTYNTLNAGNLAKLNDMADKVYNGDSPSPGDSSSVGGWMSQFPEGRPIFIGATGQSNGNGQGMIKSNMSTNPLVKDWSTVGTGGAVTGWGNSEGSFAWRTPDRSVGAKKSDYQPLNDYIGYPGGVGNIAVAMADAIANETGRTVYICQSNRDGAGVWMWSPENQANGANGMPCQGYDTLQGAMTAALATPELTAWNITVPDVMVLMQGESDAGGFIGQPWLSPDDWAAEWLRIFRADTSLFFEQNKTRVIACDIGQPYNWVEPTEIPSGSSNVSPWRWSGVSKFVIDGGYGFDMVSSVGIEPAEDGAVEGGPIHFSAAGSSMQGIVGAQILLGVVGSAHTQSNGWDLVTDPNNGGMPYLLQNQNRSTDRREAGNVNIDSGTTTVGGNFVPTGAYNQPNNIVIGTGSGNSDSGDGNIFIGQGAGSLASTGAANNTVIGNTTFFPGLSDSVWLFAGASNRITCSADGLVVNGWGVEVPTGDVVIDDGDLIINNAGQINFAANTIKMYRGTTKAMQIDSNGLKINGTLMPDQAAYDLLVARLDALENP